MATFSILVTSAPFDTQGSYSALQFAQAVLAQGHKIQGIFFYQAGVNNANAWSQAPADELNLPKAWRDLQAKGVALHVCNTAAARRGVLSEPESTERGLPAHNLQAPMQASGLGQFIEMLNVDRVVQF